MTLKERIKVLKDEIFHKQLALSQLLHSCPCTNIVKGRYGLSAICNVCDRDFGWYCTTSPLHKSCVYTVSFDCCDYCGQPEERK